MIKFLLSLFLASVSSLFVLAQKPKLVVGIVVDQMRPEYLDKFSRYFGTDGFNRLVNEGTYFTQVNFSYALTQTGPGHATVYTGVNPASHGVVSNVWFNSDLNQLVYCVADSTISGILPGAGNHRSPRNLEAPTMGDQLKSQKPASKVVSLAIKDRSAVLPGGKKADLALWWDGETGKWVSSKYYGEDLPEWLKTFESEHPASQYLAMWNPLISDDQIADDWLQIFREHNAYEVPFKGKDSTEFPYDFKALSETNGISVLKYSPSANRYTIDLAMAAIKGEKLGRDGNPDLLALSFSATDYIGHRFAPESREVMECYVQLDRDLALFLNSLDESVGKNNYVVFLTADHGVMSNVSFLAKQNFPTQTIDFKELKVNLNQAIQQKFSIEKLIAAVENDQVYFDRKVLVSQKVSAGVLQTEVVRLLLDIPAIAVAISASELQTKKQETFPLDFVQQSYIEGKSGDVMFVTRPFTGDANELLGANHGTPYGYDTHVPVIFYGSGISKGQRIKEPADVRSIVPTICRLLSIQNPPGSQAPVLKQALAN